MIAELPVGDVFGEISCLYRKKCEASVRARTALDVISLPRKQMMDVLHYNEAMRADVLSLIASRRGENQYFKSGQKKVATAMTAARAARTLTRFMRKRLFSRRSKSNAVPSRVSMSRYFPQACADEGRWRRNDILSA